MTTAAESRQIVATNRATTEAIATAATAPPLPTVAVDVLQATLFPGVQR